MRKQLRCADILYTSLNIAISIKGIKQIIIEHRGYAFAQHWIIHTEFIDNTIISRRIDLAFKDNIFIHDLNQYVKDVNKYLKELKNDSNNKT